MTPPLSRLWPAAVAIALCGWMMPAAASDPPAADYEPDLFNGEEINELCAGCHGEFGQGGGDGKYPRLAGLPATYIERQMFLFRARQRPNLPMVEHVDERQMPDNDIRDVAAFLARIQLPTKLPPQDEGAQFDPLERLLLAKRTMNIRRAPGDIKAGRKLYNRECRSCHGTDGWGETNKGVPLLTGQYTEYLWGQVAKYRNGLRIHDPDAPDERLLSLLTDDELRDIFAFLSVADD